jgi:Phage protein (N4 Gp49/phage Sf6 gene 66) family
MSQNTVTQEQIKIIMGNSNVEVKTILGKCTVVACQLPNGFIIVESSACVDPANYDEKLGADICLKRIENKVWELEGYKLQSKLAE